MPEYDFSGKVAFVTGASHGQGESHATTYAKHGADVAVLDTFETKDSVPYPLGSREELEDTASQIEEEGQEALVLEGDISNEDDVESAVEEALDEFGKIDILANNAGVASVGDATEMDEQTWDETMDTDCKGAFLCSKHVGKHFKERGEGGKIVSTASTAGLVGSPSFPHYTAAKHGVVGLTKSLALEFAPHGVTVNAVAPSAVETQMVTGLVEEHSEEVFEKFVELGGPFNLFDPEKGAVDCIDTTEAYMWLSSDASRFVTGHTLPVDGGFVIK